MFALLLLTFACPSPADDPQPRPPLPEVEPIPGDTAPDDTGGDPEPEPDSYDHLYTLDAVNEIDITLDEESVRDLRTNGREYTDATVTINGETYEQVAVKLKGSGSYQELNGKPAFKIDFNHFAPDQSYRGKGKLTLNNMTHDETQLHEVVAYAAFAAAGLPASRVGYAWVTVNGQDYGLYSNVETADRDYLERNFGNRDGNLYEGGYPQYPESYAHADFSTSEVGNFELETGSEGGLADLERVVEALTAADLVAELGARVDLRAYARFQLVEAWTGQWDGYAFASNNYRVFVDLGQTGLVKLVPTGLDYCFTSYGGSLRRSRMPLGRACQGNPDCNAYYGEELEDVLADIEAANLPALMEEALVLITPYVEADPKNLIDESRNWPRSLDVMRTWLDERDAQVRAWYGPREE